MIVQLMGNVKFPITLDPTVWIFDDRKILLEEAFSTEKHTETADSETIKTADRLNRELYQQKVRPPVNKSITKYEREKILKNSYVMPIHDFLDHAEILEEAQDVTLVTKSGEKTISLTALHNCYLLFSVDGKPLITDGPVHLLFKDGSNQDAPITGIEKIIIN